ncbi:MAG: TolC family protein [Pseudomonadota bacterium]
MMGRLLPAIAGLGFALAVAAQPEESLSLGTVLDRSARHAPKILEARQAVRASEARRLGAEGNFDRTFDASGFARTSGFYSGKYIGTRLSQPLQNNGGEIYGGYRISNNDDFPIYEDEYITLSGGEAEVGAKLALLRDREFDRRRYSLLEADLAIEMAELDLLLQSIGIQHGAVRAYWRWVAAGLRLTIYQDLLKIAEDRVTALSLRLNEGDVAQIDIVENAQRILFRRSLAINARRDLDNAAITLSLYNRDEVGEPAIPDPLLLPETLPITTDDMGRDIDREIALALERQAELALIDRKLELATSKRRLGENELLPEVDLGVKVARDFGSGSPTRDQTDLIFGLEVSVPLERRKAKSEIALADIETERLSLQRRDLEDRIRAEVTQLANIIDASRVNSTFADLEVDQAQRLESAEWIRFEEGASNFFLLNLREESTADARLRAVGAALAYQLAVADYLAITADAEALGVIVP